jgi:hypothetical protein
MSLLIGIHILFKIEGRGEFYAAVIPSTPPLFLSALPGQSFWPVI